MMEVMKSPRSRKLVPFQPITGHFARIVDTFKENEATADPIVRGRQILFMLHHHVSTNIKHGATYASWDQLLAGIIKVPGNDVLETLFYNQVKNSKSLAHDLNEYQRAEEGSEKHSYDFLDATWIGND